MRRMLVCALLLPVAAPAGAEWSQWRGAARDGAGDRESTIAWQERLIPAWRAEVGLGQSSPVVAGGAVFQFTREGDDEVARALDLESGRELWRAAYRAPYQVYPGALDFGAGPKSTPVAHGGRLFTLGVSGILSAYDAGDGRLLWRRDFDARFAKTAPPFGTAMSPIVAAGRLVAHVGGHDGGALIGFDPETGREEWALEGDGPSYSSPILAVLGGRPQLVIQVHRSILGVDPASGERLWSLPFVTPCDQNIVTPVVAGEVLVVSSVDHGTLGVRVEKEAAGWRPHIVWHTQEVSLYMSSPLLAGEALLGLSHRKRGQYFALEPGSGAVRWKSEGGRGENAAFVRLGETVVILEGDGRLLVGPAPVKGFEPARVYHVASSPTYAHPVPAAGGLLIKDESALALFRPGIEE